MDEFIKNLESRLSSIKAEIASLEAKKTTIIDTKALKEINCRINELQASISPLKKEIEYEKCLSTEIYKSDREN